jgi:hypothetical protein
MATYLTHYTPDGWKETPIAKELFRVPSRIVTEPVEGSRPTRMYLTDERGDPVTTKEPVPVRWDDRLGAYVRA